MAKKCFLYTDDQIDKKTGEPKEGEIGIDTSDRVAVQRFLLENADKLTPEDLGVKPKEKPKLTQDETIVKKVRSLYSRFAKDETKPKALREAIAKADKYYEESSNKFTSQMADAMIEVAKEAGEVDALWEEASRFDMGALEAHAVPVKAMMMSKIANYYEATGQMEKAAEAYGKMFRTATNAGKLTQVWAAQSHPEAILARAKYNLHIKKQQALKKENPATGKTNQETIEEIHDIAQEGAAEAATKLGGNKNIAEAAKKTAEKKTKRERSEAYRAKVKSDLKAAVTALNEALGINISLDDDVQAQGLTMGNLINLIAEAAVAAKTATETIEEAIDRVVAVLKKKGLISSKFDEGQLKKSSLDRIQRNQTKADKNKVKEARKFIKEQLSEQYDVNLKQIVEKYYDDSNAFKGSLVDTLMSEGGLDIDEAKAFAKVVEAEYDKLLEETKKRIADRINKIIPPNASELAARANKRLTQKINKALLLGRVDMKDFSDLFGDALGFVVLTPEMDRKISDLKDGLKIFPEGSKEYYKRLQLFNTYLDKIRISQLPPTRRALAHIGKLLRDLFYNNLLSGAGTFITNVKGILHVAAPTTAVSAMIKGRGTDGFKLYLEGMKSFAKGIGQGIPEFKQIIADGFNSQYASEEAKQPIGPLRAIMAKPISEAAWYEIPIKALQYLPVKMVRAFIATDALAKNGLREYFATLKAYDEMLIAGQDRAAKNFWRNVHEMAQNTKEEFDEFKEQAAVEEAGYKARGISVDKNFIGIRAAELAQQARTDVIADYAELMAQRSTLNNKPEGTFGFVYQILNQIQTKIAGAYTQIPFIKIGINMVDTWLAWSPYGFKRAIFGRGIGFEANKKNWNLYRIGKEGDADWKEDRQFHVARAAVGTLVYAYLAAALVDLLDDDDETASWNIIKNVTANLSDDQAAAYQYQQGSKGLKPYTVYFAWGGELYYKESIFAPVFSWLGYSMDEKRENKRKDAETGLTPAEQKTKAGAMLDNSLNSMFFIKEYSFIQNFSEMLSIGGKMQSYTGNADAVTKGATNTIKNYMYPKFYESMYKGYKTVTNAPEMRPVKASDGSYISAIVENFAKNVPYLETKIENKYYDQLGNDVTAKYYNVFPIPFIQQTSVETMRDILGIQNMDYENYRVANELGISVDYKIPTTDANGNKLNTTQKNRLAKSVADFASKRLLEEQERLSKLSPKARQRTFDDFVAEGFKFYKDKYFGKKEILPPPPISPIEKAIKAKTDIEIKKIK